MLLLVCVPAFKKTLFSRKMVLSSERNLVGDQGLLGECQGMPGMKVMRCREEGQGCLGTHTHTYAQYTHNSGAWGGEGHGLPGGGECQGLPGGSQGCLGPRFVSLYA